MKTPARRRNRLLPIAAIVALAAASCTAGSTPPQRVAAAGSDLVIYGCTSAGVIAAITAREHGKSVTLLCQRDYVGGMTTNGLGYSDTGNHGVIGGLSLEFYKRLKQHYDQPAAWKHGADRAAQQPGFVADGAQWIFEPSAAEAVYDSWLASAGVTPVFDSLIDRGPGGVEKAGDRIVSIRTMGGKRYAGRMFIDATYEGDLMAAAGVGYTTGRESNQTYGETLNGVQLAKTTSHQFEADVDPYRIPGRPESGLLPYVSGERPQPDGTGDDKIQAYTYRLCLTDVAANRAPLPRPADYDAGDYQLLARYLAKGFNEVFRKFDRVPNGKTDVNNWGAFSFDGIGLNHAYPEASYAERDAILAKHVRYQQGLLWFLGHDPQVPAAVRTEMSRWGLCKDEFVRNGNWPREIYVREGRRMASDFVMAEPHLRGKSPTPEPVGMGSYNMDSHNVQRIVDARGFARNEGNIEVNPGDAYPISYRAIVPKRAEASNLLVPVALSASHIAYGSIRMEPVFMILGQSAATAAALAIDARVAVQDVDYAALRKDLLAHGQTLEKPARALERRMDN
ncbi:FAD-dependent oxidoreductase [Sphingomonas hengshuiensis]|uniref:FAD-dependent oxidoreductase n=1 Tax=Sphingomonas hengshuiensis TaxID=1609977 RepID=UPI00069709B7|nr:FAD-dependent oxidoreductase [Sphingomonas hengshuiensis]